MHFHSPPYSHDKIVSCIDGEVFDVIVDLRSTSKTYLKALSFNLKGISGDSLFIPKGCAHGFQVLSQEGAWIAYYTSGEYRPENDLGVHWNSVKINWPLSNPIVSERDEKLPKMGDGVFFK